MQPRRGKRERAAAVFLNLDTEVWPDVFLRLDEAAVRAPQERRRLSAVSFPMKQGITSIP